MSEVVAPAVSVVVPHHNDLAGLDACLGALGRQAWPGVFEVVVADNNSPQGLAAVEAVTRGRARVVAVSEPGAGPARNGGVAASRGEILAFTDADCLPEPDWLAEGLAALEESDFVGGAMRVLTTDPDQMTPAEAFETVFAFDNETYVLRKGFTVTANLLCRRKVFEAVGGFRVGVSEDLDWSHRARAAGFRIAYAAKAVVGHPARRTWDELTGKWRRLEREAYGLHRANGGDRAAWLVRSLALPASAAAHTPKVLKDERLGSLDQKMAALAVLYRLRAWRMATALKLLAAG